MAQIIETVDTPDGKMHGVILTDNELHVIRFLVGQCSRESNDACVPGFFNVLCRQIRDTKHKFVKNGIPTIYYEERK